MTMAVRARVSALERLATLLRGRLPERRVDAAPDASLLRPQWRWRVGLGLSRYSSSRRRDIARRGAVRGRLRDIVEDAVNLNVLRPLLASLILLVFMVFLLHSVSASQPVDLEDGFRQNVSAVDAAAPEKRNAEDDQVRPSYSCVSALRGGMQSIRTHRGKDYHQLAE